MLGGGRLCQVVEDDVLAKVLLGELDGLRRSINPYQLHNLQELQIKFQLAARILQLRLICVAPAQGGVYCLIPDTIDF